MNSNTEDLKCNVPSQKRFEHVGHLLRAATDANPRVTVLTFCGQRYWEDWRQCRVHGSLLPFVRMLYLQVTSCSMIKQLHMW